MTSSVKLLCFAGSTRIGSFNAKLAKLAAETGLAHGAEAKLIDLSDYPMPLYNADLEAREGQPEAAHALKREFAAHQAIFIASPEYNSGVTPLLKNTLDWVSRIRDEGEPPLAVYKTRVFAIGSASPGVYGGMRSLLMLRQILAVGLGALVIPEQIAIPNAAQAFDEEGRVKDERHSILLRTVMSKLVSTAAHFAS